MRSSRGSVRHWFDGEIEEVGVRSGRLSRLIWPVNSCRRMTLPSRRKAGAPATRRSLGRPVSENQEAQTA